MAVAIAVSRLLYGFVHLANTGASLLAIAVIAITRAVNYALTRRLGFAVGFHVGWNVAMDVLFGHPSAAAKCPPVFSSWT